MLFTFVSVEFRCSVEDEEKLDTFSEELVWEDEDEAEELRVVCCVEFDPLADGSDEDFVEARKLEFDLHPNIGTLFWRFNDKALAMPIILKLENS